MKSGSNLERVLDAGHFAVTVEIGPPMDTEVKEKALAAQRWCQTASGIPGGKPWEYKLIPDDAIDAANDFRFTVSQARRFD